MWPYPVKHMVGKITPYLEISYEHGKKVLNTANVNYSFGSLHDVFRRALLKAKIMEFPPSEVLILGFGAGSIATIIIDEFGLQSNLYGVEADPVVIQIANEEFDLKRFPSLEMENCTAEQFISINERKFDLIAVDVFVEAKVPESCKTNEFLTGLYSALNKNGRVVFNEMPGKEFSDDDELANRFRTNFDELEIQKLNMGGSPNRIFIGYRRK